MTGGAVGRDLRAVCSTAAVVALLVAVSGCAGEASPGASAAPSAAGAAAGTSAVRPAGAGASPSGTAASDGRPADPDREAARRIIERYYGALASRDWAAARALLVGEVADSFDPEAATGDSTLIGFDVERITADEQIAAAEVLERVKGGEGNTGVLRARYTLEKTSDGWRISSIEFDD